VIIHPIAAPSRVIEFFASMIIKGKEKR